MNIRNLLLAGTFIITTTAQAQPGEGRKNIEKLCGCFSVNFRYAETFSPIDTYKRHLHEDQNAMELALPIEMSDKKVVIQHLLLINDTMVIKHWREEWVYEQPFMYAYKGNKVWERKTLSSEAVKNRWVQTVWEVNDEPRYQGISTWIQNDGATYWESTADAPLPRREYTTRNDYNVLRRRNRIVITNEGYVHEQDNDKIIRATGEADKLLVQEKGYNTYYKADETDCAAAKAWWKKNEPFWTVVRSEWDKALQQAAIVTVKAKADDKTLTDYFTALWKDWNGKKIKQDELAAKVKEVVTKFLL